MQQAGKPIKINATRAEVTNMRPASRMRPLKEFPAAREHFGETSTFKLSFPI